jgi:glycosyltransferase involved in cell wall biosynthesis
VNTNKVSLVMIVKNEEKYIKRCLDSTKSSVDEMIVIDTGSNDRSKQIAKNCGANVYDFTWINDFSAARNFGLSKASGNWILVLDADEYFEKDYRKTIQEHIKKGNVVGRIAQRSKFDDNGKTLESISYVSRLFPKGVTYEGKIHEQLKTEISRAIVPIECLHDGYYFTDKTERNISLLEKELQDNPNDPYYLLQIGREYRSRREYEKANDYFLKSYNLINRFENYSPSIIIEYLNSLNKSNHYIEALRLIEKEETYLKDHPDFHFAKGIILMNYLSTLPNPNNEDVHKIEKAFLECLKIGESNKYETVIGTGSFLAAFNLGLCYELFRLNEKARYFYTLSANQNYQPAINRLNSFQ